jgi:tRNA-binding protein
MKHISFEDFKTIEMRVGRIIRVEEFPEAKRPALKLWIDFGKLGVKKSSAQITKFYNKENLMKMLVIAVINFPPKQVANFISEVLVLGVVCNEEEVVLIRPDREVQTGLRIL